jgi:YfiH family protein
LAARFIEQHILSANWPAPNNVHAGVTMRHGGVSQAPFADFNLSHTVGESIETVLQNRSLLRQKINLPAEPVWLNQQHTNLIIDAAAMYQGEPADGAYTCQDDTVCVALTADCLPILLCSTNGKEVAALHAGWRGLADGIIAVGVQCFNCGAEQILAWLGPAISKVAFEVGDEIRQLFLQRYSCAATAFYPAKNSEHWMTDIYQLATLQLQNLGITKIYGGNFCTYTDSKRFYSYRRDGQTGRMASLIWKTSAPNLTF